MRIKKWLAAVLGLPQGMQITVPPGAVLIMSASCSVDTINVAGGNVHWARSIEETVDVISGLDCLDVHGVYKPTVTELPEETQRRMRGEE